METQSYLRPAVLQDLINTETQLLIENRIYFVRYPDGHLEGPFRNDYQDDYIIELSLQIKDNMVFVPYFQPGHNVIECTLILREAVKEDFSFRNNTLYYGTSYYLMIAGRIAGAYLLTEATLIEDLDKQLQTKIAYVLEHKSLQTFPEINQVKKAS